MKKLFLLLLLAQSAQAGTLTNAAELAVFKTYADASTEPYASRRTSLLADSAVTDAWSHGTVTGAAPAVNSSCRIGAASEDYLVTASPDVLAMLAAAALTTNGSQATTLKTSARTQILDLLDTTYANTYSGSNECILSLGLSLPRWIEAAQLAAELGSPWTLTDTTNFQNWLITVYPKVAWASRIRKNNWGAAGSLSSWLIANYVPSGATLTEVDPQPRILTPVQAKSEHLVMQQDRIKNIWPGDSDCTIFGIQSHGGIPDELRRGTTGCFGDHLLAADSSRSYQTMHVELLIFHARALQRTGTNVLWLEANEAIKRAILFVIDNPLGSQSWDDNRFGGAFIASKVYSNPTLSAYAASVTTFRGGLNLPYARIFGVAPEFNEPPPPAAPVLR